MENMQRLNQIPSGTGAVVRDIEGRDSAMLRVMAMGLCVGRQLEVVRQGNPLIVRLLGARVGLSGRLAQRIIVERSEP
jgi:Fe2+ transport system protein FeoA